jgi:RHS repeat-associated protein
MMGYLVIKPRRTTLTPLTLPRRLVMAQAVLVSTLIRMSALISASLLLILILSAEALGQGSTPQRGFQPGGSYALSDIETINTTNGNLMLNLALGKLAPGRGGLSGQLNLHYDSKLYDSHTEYYEDWDNLVFGQPQVVIRNMLRTSDQGGWHYGTGYELQLIDRLSQYPLEIMPQYPDPATLYHYKVKVAFPDGSLHEFLPRIGSQFDEGYSDFRPDGWRTQFDGSHTIDVPYLTSTFTYYTFDGTYIRLEVQHDSDGSWANNPWTLYFPDGTKVTNYGTRITDRNGNYVEFSNITYNGHAATQLMDQLGRKVILEHQGFSGGDVIHVPGVGGVDLTYRVYWDAVQVYKTYSTAEFQVGQDPDGYPEMLNYQFVVSQIDLPAETGGLTYLFGYNAADYGSTPCCTPSYGWGELSSVTLPSGAQAQYQYLLDGQNGPGFGYLWTDVLGNRVTRKSLTYQQQYDGNSSPVTETWNYDIGIGAATLVMPDGGVVKQLGQPTRRTENADGSINEKIWQANRPQGFPSTSGYDPVTAMDTYDPQGVNPYVKTEFTSIRDASGALTKTAIKDYNYDKNGNVTLVKEYDWVDYGSVPRNAGGLPTGIPASAVLKRVTTNSYANATPDASDTSSNDADSYWNSTAPALKNVVAASEVSNGSATLSRTEFTYDNASTTGNLTQQKTWDSTKGAYSNPLTSGNSISVSHQYDGYGNPTLSTDARGYQTQFLYGSIGGFTDLFPTQVKTAFQTAVQRTETREYDFSTGLVTRVTDVDNNVSTATTYDVFGRPTLVKAAEGKPEETRTSTSYSDVNRRVIMKSDLNTVGDEKLVSIQHYDQLGRLRLTRQLEDATTQSPTDETAGIKVQTRHQISGNFSYVLTSNPYRAATSVTAGSETTMGWSRSKSDNGGRVIEVQTFGGATAPAPWEVNTASTGTVTSSYDGNSTTVTDQAGKVRRSITDGLGRLIRVDEPDANGSLGSISSPVQPTSYDYDALGNLKTVTQGGQTRSFVYSSLSRLTSASNPESGTISYQYDNNGNLTQKTDARNIVITYQYDELNRNTSVNYSNTTIGSPDVPDITRFYDGATNGRGRFWYSYTAGNLSVGSNVEHTAVDSYDALGRPLVQRQLFKLNGSWGPTYQTSRAYNRAGGVTTQSYPSGHAVTYNYDGAGRLADKDAQNLAFTGNLGDGVQRTYASGISYVASGALKQEKFGTTTTPVYNKLFYNSRLQLAEILTSTSANDSSWNRGKIVNDYSLQCSGAGCNANDNNGNLRKQQLYVPANDQVSSWTSWYQQYDYDSLNRLKRVHEYTGNTPLDWQQEYDYDRWGNRTLNAAGTWIGDASNLPNPALNETVFETGALAATNRLYAPGDLALLENQRRMRYDAAGNLSVDTYTGAGERVYDAENRMTQAWANNQWQYYTYNADGQRTRRKINTLETWQIYGFDGELLAEYAANGAATSPQKEYGYRNGQLLVTAEPASSSNVALASSGATATGSTTLSPYVAGNVIDGSRRALNGTIWLDNTFNSFPDWVEISFNGSKTISEIDVITQQDDPQDPVEPTLAQTFSLYGITAFDVQYWNGSGWTTVPGGSVTGNNKVWRQFNFSPVTTTKIRVVVNGGADNAFSRVVEVEAWTGASSGSAQIRWLVADHLGTPRLILDQTGSLANASRHDYLPFGEEIFALGLRPSLGYSGADGVHQQFTSRERDVETGLDYFLARYYSSTQGRFSSKDPYNPILNSENEQEFLRYLTQPQNWNRYAYVANNPLRYVDPTGELLELTGDIDAAFERIKALVGGAANLLYTYKKDGHTYVDYRGSHSDAGQNINALVKADAGGINVYIAKVIGSDSKTIEFQVADSFDTKFRTGVKTWGGDCGGA